MAEARREGKWMHYRLVEPLDEQAARVFRDIRAWLREEPQMQRDRTRLVKVCCASNLPQQLRGAPRPASVLQE